MLPPKGASATEFPAWGEIGRDLLRFGALYGVVLGTLAALIALKR